MLDNNQISLDESKVSNLLQTFLKQINEHQMTIRELIILYGNLGYVIGASIAGFENVGPDLETLKKAYYTNPTIDVGFMLQGLTITNWEHSFLEKPVISDLLKINKKEDTE